MSLPRWTFPSFHSQPITFGTINGIAYNDDEILKRNDPQDGIFLLNVGRFQPITPITCFLSNTHFTPKITNRLNINRHVQRMVLFDLLSMTITQPTTLMLKSTWNS
jgi:hypothetical protein